MFRRLWLNLKDYKFEKRMVKQRAKRRYSDDMVWGMYYWFLEILPMMLYDLRDNNYGAPELPFEEVDTFPEDWKQEQLEIIKKIYIERDIDFEENDIFTKWKLIISRIAWCLEQADENKTEIYNEYYEEYHKQLWGEDYEDSFNSKNWMDKIFSVIKRDKKGKPLLYKLNTKEVSEDLAKKYFDKDLEIYEYRCKMKDEAFDLLKKYFYNLWD